MAFIDILAIIVFAVVITRQNDRIRKLERLFTGSVPIKPQTQKTPSAPATTISSIPAEPVSEVNSIPTVSSASAVETPHEEVSSGRILGIIGIAAVFIGVAFFLKYAFDNNWIGPMGRIMIGVLAGFALIGVGQYLRKKYIEYSDLLIGGGLALLYLSVFSAHFFFGLISPFTAWFFMALITALGFSISIANATVVLAFVSLVGGFLVPFMARSGGDDMLPLFGYLAILNIGVLALSFFRKWPELAFTAFIGTVINFGAWYAIFYSPSALGSTLSFCFLTFLIFLASTMARSFVLHEKAKEADYASLGGNALFLASMGYAMLESSHHDLLTPLSLFVAAIYLVVALMANKKSRKDVSLNIFLPGLSVTFLTLAVPLYFDGNWVAVMWIVESVALYLMASKIGNRGFQVMGAVLYILGLTSFFSSSAAWSAGNDFTPIFNESFGISALAIVAAYGIAFMYKRYGSVSLNVQKRGLSAFTVGANILTIYAVSAQIIFFFAGIGGDSAQNYSNTLVSIYWALYAALLTAVGFSKRIAGVRRLGLILFIFTAFKVFIDVWSLGQVYRIVSFIVFGVIALCASFVYAKYKDRLKEVI